MTTYVGASENEGAEDKLEIAQQLGTEHEGTNTSKTPLKRLRHALEEIRDGVHFGEYSNGHNSKERGLSEGKGQLLDQDSQDLQPLGSWPARNN